MSTDKAATANIVNMATATRRIVIPRSRFRFGDIHAMELPQFKFCMTDTIVIFVLSEYRAPETTKLITRLNCHLYGYIRVTRVASTVRGVVYGAGRADEKVYPRSIFKVRTSTQLPVELKLQASEPAGDASAPSRPQLLTLAAAK